MPSLIDFSESECISYTIGRELNQLERLASARHSFKTAELMDLHHCLDRMSQIVGTLAGKADDEPLPDWLRRTGDNGPDEADETQSV